MRRDLLEAVKILSTYCKANKCESCDLEEVMLCGSEGPGFPNRWDVKEWVPFSDSLHAARRLKETVIKKSSSMEHEWMLDRDGIRLGNNNCIWERLTFKEAFKKLKFRNGDPFGVKRRLDQ